MENEALDIKKTTTWKRNELINRSNHPEVIEAIKELMLRHNLQSLNASFPDAIIEDN